MIILEKFIGILVMRWFLIISLIYSYSSGWVCVYNRKFNLLCKNMYMSNVHHGNNDFDGLLKAISAVVSNLYAGFIFL